MKIISRENVKKKIRKTDLHLVNPELMGNDDDYEYRGARGILGSESGHRDGGSHV